MHPLWPAQGGQWFKSWPMPAPWPTPQLWHAQCLEPEQSPLPLQITVPCRKRRPGCAQAKQWKQQGQKGKDSAAPCPVWQWTGPFHRQRLHGQNQSLNALTHSCTRERRYCVCIESYDSLESHLQVSSRQIHLPLDSALWMEKSLRYSAPSFLYVHWILLESHDTWAPLSNTNRIICGLWLVILYVNIKKPYLKYINCT